MNEGEFEQACGGCSHDDKHEVQRVAVRVPQFWPEEPALWFAQLEQQFLLSGVTSDQTKFAHLSTNLDLAYAREVRDIITKPPATGKYEKLKTELIRRLSISHERRVKQLLTYEELGDRRPSQFLRHLENLAGPSIPKDFLQTIWSSRLPQNIQTVLASQPSLDLDNLADLADRVYDLAQSTPVVAATSSAAHPSSSTAAPSSEHLLEEIRQLKERLADLTVANQHHARSRSRSRYDRYSRSRSRSRPQQPPPGHPHCFYHYTYGDKAKKCKPPCTFQAVNSQGSRK